MTSQRSRILIVEDDLATRYGYERYLRDTGVETTIASTVREALILLDSIKMDGVILDLKLPDMRGEAVLQTIRARLGTAKAIPVVVATGGELEGLREADRVFQKPVSAEAVCTALLDLLKF